MTSMKGWEWRSIPLILEIGRQQQMNLCEFKVSLVDKASTGQPGLQSETLSQKIKIIRV